MDTRYEFLIRKVKDFTPIPCAATEKHNKIIINMQKRGDKGMTVTYELDVYW